jgi:ribonuclease BN (tRNA processing enzyme)
VGTDQRLSRFAADADVLIHDAQYSSETYLGVPTQGFGHSTAAMAVDLARASRAGRLVLFHHDPRSDDEAVDRVERSAAALLPGTVAAREGLTIEV